MAMAGAAVYIPLILVGAAVMSEPLFAALLLGALAAAIQHRRSTHRWRWVLLAGFLGGLTILTRANALVLLLPLALAVWTVRPRFSPRALAAPAVLVVLALLTVSPWTIRNAVVFDRFIPVSTQLGSALAGTYNDQARLDKENPASWRSIRHLPEYRALYARLGEIPEPVVEDELRDSARRPTSASTRATSAWSRGGRRGGCSSSAGSTGRATRRRRSASARAGRTPASSASGSSRCWRWPARSRSCARRTPFFVWLIPILLYLSVVFLVVETPRYRTGIDPFIVMLAALALRRVLPGAGDRELPPPDQARYPTSPKAPTPA